MSKRDESADVAADAVDEEHKKSTPPRVHRHTLVEINRAAFTARREAAHSRAVELLQREILKSSKADRVELYTFCLKLLDDAIMATERSQIERDTPVFQYLNLLRETVSANMALVNHEVALVEQSSQFARVLGDSVLARFQIDGDVFSDSERNVLESIAELLEFGTPILMADDNERKARFSENDQRRYAAALSEYAAYYHRPRTV